MCQNLVSKINKIKKLYLWISDFFKKLIDNFS